ncbi:shikimate dehydrogenase family protein [Christiangramia salexigens]|uniref:Shikimate dehydrogenase n=1 Tax=Christiangramia salexigens TaxID=1913577 RepID=A0A1L3J1T1_9FLAO|nr:shikimate dehydrogenase [Christiangramia salexigens]APG59073.1 shikimate dehydrogenase [Christiangramia salexigens]
MRRFGLLGKSIDYSFSRKYFSEKFNNESIDAIYQNFDIPDIAEFANILKNTPQINGLNVTIPYKEAIIPYLDDLDEHAEAIKAVNTIKIEKDGSLTGYNTDYWGFMEAIKPHLLPKHKQALILGTGGASKAIAYSLDLLGIDYQFVSRNPGEDQISYSSLNEEILQQHLLLINCTPLGTFPNTDEHPSIPIDLITENHLIFDLIYNPSETKLMSLAKEKGAASLNGYRMLELQAEKAWEIWNS